MYTQSFLSNLFSKQFYFTKHRTIIHSIFYRTCICHWTTDLKPFSICENHIPCIKNFTFIQHTIHPFNSEGFPDMIFKLMKVLLVHTMQKVAMLLWALWWRRNGKVWENIDKPPGTLLGYKLIAPHMHVLARVLQFHASSQFFFFFYYIPSCIQNYISNGYDMTPNNFILSFNYKFSLCKINLFIFYKNYLKKIISTMICD